MLLLQPNYYPHNNYQNNKTMNIVKNPFVVGTYAGPEYFCDREAETMILHKHMDNGRNVALSAPRRMGKTGLVQHFLHSEAVEKEYYCFFVDLYATKSLAEMVQMLAMEIFRRLQPAKDRWWERFATVISSLSMGFSMDPMTGQPSFSIGLGQIHQPEVTLEQIFRYLETADRPCIVAIDEFQQIADYEEKNVEAVLRTLIQRCVNTHFIYAGSKRHMMTQMFNSPSRPFYQSCMNMSLEPLPMEVYADFCQRLFEDRERRLDRDVVVFIYNMFAGYTWYMHMMMNELFVLTDKGERCTMEMVDVALENIILSQQQTYKELMAMIPPKQKMVLEAIAKEGKASGVTSSAFIKRHSLPSTSSVQAALKGLLEKEIVTQSNGVYWVYDFFLARYLKR